MEITTSCWLCVLNHLSNRGGTVKVIIYYNHLVDSLHYWKVLECQRAAMWLQVLWNMITCL